MRNILMDIAGASGTPREQVLPVANATVPYWRTELHPIDEYRSTDKLPKSCDIAIVGAGLSGVSTAYHLSHLAVAAGVEVPSIVLLEARQVCSGATGRNGGHVKSKVDSLIGLGGKHGVSVAEEFADFVNEQIFALKQTVEREHIDCEFELRRSWDAFLDDAEADKIRGEFDACLKEGQRWTRERHVLIGDMAEQVTSLKGARAAVSAPACSFWPYKFVTQLLNKLVAQHQVNLQTNTPVTAVKQESGGHSILQTPRGSLKASKVVFATNGYTSGICSMYEDCITPYKGTACHITPKSGPISPHLSATYNISYPPGPARTDYLNPRPDGGIVVGGAKWKFEHREALWNRNWDDSTLLPGAKDHFDGLMQRHFKGWEESGAEVDHIWTGVQASTPDMMPHVGEVPGKEGRHYILAGYNGGGNALVFLCAQGVAKMVLNGSNFESTGLPSFFKTTPPRLHTTTH